MNTPYYENNEAYHNMCNLCLIPAEIYGSGHTMCSEPGKDGHSMINRNTYDHCISVNAFRTRDTQVGRFNSGDGFDAAKPGHSGSMIQSGSEEKEKMHEQRVDFVSWDHNPDGQLSLTEAKKFLRAVWC